MIKKLLVIFLLIYPQFSHSSEEIDFNIWLDKFKIKALKKGISEKTITNSFKNAKYLKRIYQENRFKSIKKCYESTFFYLTNN